MRRFLLALTLLISSFSEPADAQSVCLPLPRLLTTAPLGAAIGSEVEVSITGENLEEVSALLFSEPAIQAEPLRDPQGTVIANRFRVRIAPNCPPGIYDARVLSRLGVSSARAFSVSPLQELLQTSPNHSLENAIELPVPSICNGRVTAKSMDYYAFHAEAGQRYIIQCAARGIDSKLDPVVILADAEGRDLVVDRLGDQIDFVASRTGKHTIKIHELTFKGGPEFFYRLMLVNLPADASLPTHPTTRPVHAFSWPPAGIESQGSQTEIEPNNDPRTPQRITLPCDLEGSFAEAADVDLFRFEAKKGEVWYIEVASERLGRPTDPHVLVQHIRGEGESPEVTDLLELADIPSPVKVSSNGYAYDGPPFNAGSLDILGKLEIPEDGSYQLLLSDLFGGTRKDPRNRYRLIIRRPQPDFAVVAWPLHMELRNGDRNALSKPLALRPGSTMALEVVSLRRDGFDGEIRLALSDLPPGVRGTGLSIAPGKNRGIMLVTAGEHAAPGFSLASFQAIANIDGQSISHPVHLAQPAWPIPDSWGEIPVPRLVSQIPVSVTDSEVAPITIAAAEEKVWQAPTGTSLTIPLKHVYRSEFSGSILQARAVGEGFESLPRVDLPLDANASQVVVDLAALKIPPGEYVFALYGSAVVKYRYDPNAVSIAQDAVSKATADLEELRQRLEALRLSLGTASEDGKKMLEMECEMCEKEQLSLEMRLAELQQQLQVATDRSAPRDTAEIILSEPLSIRVTAAE